MLVICVEHLYRFFVSLEPPCIIFNSVFSLLICVPYYVIGLFLSLHILIESNIRIGIRLWLLFIISYISFTVTGVTSLIINGDSVTNMQTFIFSILFTPTFIGLLIYVIWIGVVRSCTNFIKSIDTPLV